MQAKREQLKGAAIPPSFPNCWLIRTFLTVAANISNKANIYVLSFLDK